MAADRDDDLDAIRRIADNASHPTTATAAQALALVQVAKAMRDISESLERIEARLRPRQRVGPF